MKPPTWERWHVALNVTGGDRWFSIADEHLPVNNLVTNKELLTKWMKRHSVSSSDEAKKDIFQQARNRFVDLCLIGLQDEAIRICQHVPKSRWFATLDYSSEVFAYPYVMGAGGALITSQKTEQHINEYFFN